MTHYYVNKNAQSNGDHEVHTGECKFLPDVTNQKYLGYFSNCRYAVLEAKKYYTQVNGCKFCAIDCHTG